MPVESSQSQANFYLLSKIFNKDAPSIHFFDSQRAAVS